MLTLFIFDHDMSTVHYLTDQSGSLGVAVRSFDDGERCLEQLQNSDCHLIFADLDVVKLAGDNFLSVLTETAPWVPVIVTASSPSISDTVGVMKAGAVDFLEKPVSPSTWEQAVREHILGYDSPARELFAALTENERIILCLLLLGWSNQEIAAKVGRSVRTVEGHHEGIYAKFGVRNMAELTCKACKLGLVRRQRRPLAEQ